MTAPKSLCNSPLLRLFKVFKTESAASILETLLLTLDLNSRGERKQKFRAAVPGAGHGFNSVGTGAAAESQIPGAEKVVVGRERARAQARSGSAHFGRSGAYWPGIPVQPYEG